ncbi:MAG TPA: CBS domain-containing protein [Pirellulales bacterium]|jgi:CBS domain-containing protein|nr:CBS domain-containing protein [Pirellulales bacterium]
MSIGRICQRDVDIVGPKDSVLVAAERMRSRTVGCLVVVEQGQTPVGILTDRDLIIRVLAEERDARATTVGEVMTRFPDLAQEDMPIETALGLMRRRAFRRLPVIDKHGRLAGLVTLDDILMLLAEEFMQIGDLLGRETPQSAAVAG